LKAGVETLVNDGFAGEATKRVLAYLQKQRENGKNSVGVYCGYAPMEAIRAVGAAPAVLCAFANKTIEAAETVLPANICPLISNRIQWSMWFFMPAIIITLNLTR